MLRKRVASLSGSLYGAFFVKPVRRGLSFFLVSFFVRSGARFFVPTHKSQTLSRAGAVKVGRRANVAAGSIIARPYLDGSEHDGTLGVVGMTLSRGARLVGARIAPHACIRRVSYDPNHDAVMRIGCEAPRRRTHSISRHQSHAAGRDPATSNCHRRPIAKRANRARSCHGASAILPSVCGTQGDALGHHAIADEVPQGDQELARQGHDHLLARAPGVLGASSVPSSQGAVLLEPEKPPG